MGIKIIEIKARCDDPDRIRSVLRALDARFVGEDHQADTYYRVESGRLKLREGQIENTLIFYDRPNQDGPKRSDVKLFKTSADSGLKQVLDAALDAWVAVDKRREIYFIDNVKFHIDRVEGLGSFVEIEAIDEEDTFQESELQEQCEKYVRLFGISAEDLIDRSYSDLLSDR